MPCDTKQFRYDLKIIFTYEKEKNTWNFTKIICFYKITNQFLLWFNCLRKCEIGLMVDSFSRHFRLVTPR